MIRATASDIVSAVGHLPRNQVYHYINQKTRGQIEIVDVVRPEGPITIKRYNPSNGGTAGNVKAESISTQMIWRIANALLPHQPINFDRVLGASYNTRSVLEALLVHTPQFYSCNPGRIENTNGSSEIKKGHKHVIWCPDEPHRLGVLAFKDIDMVISEMPNIDAYYDALTIPDNVLIDVDDPLAGKIDIDVKRRHAQIQIALITIGQQLSFRTWIAQNDKGIIYKGRRIGEMDGVISSLRDERLIAAFEGAFKAAYLIDCIWFKNGRLMPAVMEIEHTTGITSGLTRMKGLQDTLPSMQTRYVIVAPDEDRDKVVREINRPQFQPLKARYFPYSSVEELYALCQRRKLRGITEEFLDAYMEIPPEVS
jgi:type II restriction enzyme